MHIYAYLIKTTVIEMSTFF